MATESTEKAQAIQTSIFLTCIGKQGLEIYNTFTFSNEEDKMKLRPVMERFEAYCKPRKNITLRHNFLTHKQHDGVSFDQFVTDLKRQSAQCEFGELKDSLIKDMIIIRVEDNQLREKLLRTNDLTLDMAIKIGQASTKRHAITLSRPEARNQTTVDALQTPRQRESQLNSSSSLTTNRCKYCGSLHQRGKCPAYGKTCSKCHKLNHFAAVCLSTSRKVHYSVEGQSSDACDSAGNMDHVFIGTLFSDENSDINTLNNAKNDDRDWTIFLRSNDSVTQFKMDTGAQANVLPISTLKTLSTKPPIDKTHTRLTAYNGIDIPVMGKCILDIHHNNTIHSVPFIVADTTSPPLLGLQTCVDLNLIKRVWAMNAN